MGDSQRHKKIENLTYVGDLVGQLTKICHSNGLNNIADALSQASFEIQQEEQRLGSLSDKTFIRSVS